jgi:NAD(P)-dependent dehydrogenase (short-subunit alcohol dehydrogenase family)
MADEEHPTALITGGSRGIGAATARALARAGIDVALTYHNKQARADEVATQVQQSGARALTIECDITRATDVERLYTAVQTWSGRLDLLVLNASGGLERKRLADDPDYPTHINRDAQVLVLECFLPLMTTGGTVVFVTSHWAHLYGQISQLSAYEPIAASKHAGELALRARVDKLASAGIRLIVVTGDLVDGTITPKLLERTAPGLTAQRRNSMGALPTADEFGEAIAAAALDRSLPTGHVVDVGNSLDAMREMGGS